MGKAHPSSHARSYIPNTMFPWLIIQLLINLKKAGVGQPKYCNNAYVHVVLTNLCSIFSSCKVFWSGHDLFWSNVEQGWIVHGFCSGLILNPGLALTTFPTTRPWLLQIEGLPAKRACIGFWPIFTFCRIVLFFEQTDLFWHEKHRSIIFLSICASFSRINRCKNTQSFCWTKHKRNFLFR